MKCEICGEQTATMWIERQDRSWMPPLIYKEVSCDDCQSSTGYKILAPLVANIRSDAD